MDLMNKNLLMLKIDLAVNSGPFKQDPKLVAAIDKLFYNNTKEVLGETVLLPERKLDFAEVNQLLKQTPVENDKSLDNVIKDTYNNRKNILRKIETFLGDINKRAEEGDTPKLIIRNQRLWSNCVYDLDRELYYQNVARFRNQGDLDIGVRDVCCLLECPPWDLGIVATAKGLIAGPLKIVNNDGSVTDCSTSGGTLVPQDIQNIKEFKTSAKYILVVEKDAVFQKLLDEGALVRLRPVIILTGKGYPDVCTRQLLCRLVTELKLKALALVDADPHGYEIFLTYKYGSLAQSHLSSSLACPKLLLLGARHQDVMTLAPKASRLVLTALDKRKLASLMARPYLNTAMGSHIKQELKAMLDSGVKAEIEALASSAAALCDSYLPSKIIQAEYLG
ncbi:meiotic recombination protein W68 isoform X3 [Colias croceus]|uniref:meiotic recombination protein W68 isoform X3 n=1 Tax=Colias crocea TaxID=72248 RepID=UPI001E27A9C3|nr:meiotic recombination protein W68 isoform X3 [Colias croceus]